MEITIQKHSPGVYFEISLSPGWIYIELPFFLLLITSDKKAKELEAY